MTSTSRPDGGNHTAHEDPATKWPRCVGTGGRDASERVAAAPQRLNADQRRDMLEIIEDRHGAAATLITSQLPVSSWHEVIGEPTFADAILDRIVHNAYRLELNGESLRKRRDTPDARAPA